MAKPCTNDTPCGQFSERGHHSAVCRKLAEQGLKARPGAKHVATLEGKAPAKLGQLPDGSVLVTQSDAAARVLRRDDGPGELATDAGLAGCACGKQVMSRAAAREKDWPVVDGVEHRYSLPCRPVPERAGRAGDQPLPTPGAASVFAEVRADLDRREATGIQRYGESLQTFNGRDMGRDLEDELLDALVYTKGVRMQYRAVVEALITLGKVLRPIHLLGRPYTPTEQAALDLAQKLEVARGR